MSNYDNQTMPTTYDSGVAGSSQTGAVDKGFLSSIKGILRIVEMAVALIAFICSAVGRKGHGAGGAAGWCMFVSMFSFLIFTITFFLWLFKVMSRPSARFPVKFFEFILFAVFSGFYLISGIVAAAFGNRHPGMGAAAFFHFAMLALCVVDAVFHYRYWFSSDEGPYICGKAISGGGTSGPTTTGPPSGDSRGPTY